MVVQGMGGIMSMTGQPDGPPTRVGVSFCDLSAGMYLAIGLLAAIYKRSRGGETVKVDIAMLDCQVALLQSAITAYLQLGEVARPEGGRHPQIAPFQVFTTQDGYLVIAAGNDHLFAVMARAMDRPDLLDNPDYIDNAQRHAHIEQLEADMEKTLRKRPTQEWLDVFNRAGVPCGPVNTVAEVARDPQVAARHMIVTINDPVIGTLRVPGNPIKMVGIPERTEHKPPPAVDQDRATILALLNHT
jgi:CoA:oxalate CoA-transferase